jgi:tRNA U34 2-thiouridine synthase MnmA/TrmU
MFSGGLDSTIVAHLLKSMGLKIKALHFVLPFYSGINCPHKQIREYASQLDIPIQIEEEGEEYIEMIRNPYFGFGKNANPCVDCRIHRLSKAKRIMENEDTSFIATGEVAGQRPMSQGYNTLHAIENRAGVKGLLVRPLSAKLLAPSQAELKGIIDREKLFNWSGRGRLAQLDYAKKFNLKHASPAGGCLLTTIGSAKRFHEFVEHTPEYHLNDFKLLAYGRHFRINYKSKFIVARNESENYTMLKLLDPYENHLQMVDSLGPVGLIRGNYSEEEMRTCCSILCRFSKEKEKQSVRVALMKGESVIKMLTVIPVNDEFCEKIRI